MVSKAKEVLKQLKEGKYKPIYFLMGEEPFFIDEISDFIEENAIDESQKGFNQTILYGKDVKVADILTHARRFPMMSERQTVIVKEAQSIFDLNREGGQKLMSSYIQNPSPTTVLVFCHKNKTLDKRKGLYKSIKDTPAVVVVESGSIHEGQVPGWIKQRVAEKGLKITEKAISMLVQNIGSNLERINNELEKVSINIKSEVIDDEAIETFVGVSRDYNVFELQKALGARNKVKAYEIAAYMGENTKENPIVLINTLLFSYFSRILKLHAPAGSTAPYKDDKIAVQNYSPQDLIRIIGDIKRADLQSKGIESPSLPQGAILNELVSRILR